MGSTLEVPARTNPEEGFTLIELLIVIAIIGTLAAMITAGITRVRGKAAEAQAKNAIQTIDGGIRTFNSDMGFFPAFDQKVEEDEIEEFNAFPQLFENLCGERPPEGRGGKNTPYAELDLSDVVVEDEDNTVTGYREADADELYDPDIEKFYLDPWGVPYFYRENSTKTRQSWMINPKSYDLWSAGPNNTNEACYGLVAKEDKEYDDVTK